MLSRINLVRLGTLILFSLAFLAATAPPVRAHCDTMDGPVIKDARTALESGDITPVLKWVKADAEGEIQTAFAEARNVRVLNETARVMADRYFFETLVRIHREGEGAPYTGLKPAGSDLPLSVVEADRSLETGSDSTLQALLRQSLLTGLHKRYLEALEKSRHASESVASGREYVESYVQFVHYVERLYLDASSDPGHGREAGPDHGGHDQ
ncbi:conserved exported hypothetical protein [Candidatus Zixiibacteriota bacterium]|nr:conserved exported hypothetical protein [candidate division Zixibacteria bacterium]